jgi:hypothetical protein
MRFHSNRVLQAVTAAHFQKTGATAGTWIPIVYAVAMGSGAIGNVLLGRLFDKLGFGVLIESS